MSLAFIQSSKKGLLINSLKRGKKKRKKTNNLLQSDTWLLTQIEFITTVHSFCIYTAIPPDQWMDGRMAYRWLLNLVQFLFISISCWNRRSCGRKRTAQIHPTHRILGRVAPRAPARPPSRPWRTCPGYHCRARTCGPRPRTLTPPRRPSTSRGPHAPSARTGTCGSHHPSSIRRSSCPRIR